MYMNDGNSDADFVVIAAPTNYDSKKNFFDTSAVEAVIKLVIEYNPVERQRPRKRNWKSGCVTWKVWIGW